MSELVNRATPDQVAGGLDPNSVLPYADADMGSFVEFEGETYYEIRDVDRLPTFLLSLASDSENWMFVTSKGGLTAGRVSPDGALFPYETVDKLERSHLHTGPVTIVRILESGGDRVWEPFSASNRHVPTIERRLRRNILGNRLVFEETNREIGLTFSYRWTATEEFGWIRRVVLANKIRKDREVSVLDGLRNVLPFGAPLALYQKSSSLVDAYKRTDVDASSGLAVFSLTSRIVDRAEASEMLRANIVWSEGLDRPTISVSEESLAGFRRSGNVERESLLTGRRGSYFVSDRLSLGPAGTDEATKQWRLVADAGQSQAAVSRLSARLQASDSMGEELAGAEARAVQGLRHLVGTSDGNQLTADESTSVHHYANVLYNTMRGGVFADNGRVEWAEFRRFIQGRNRAVSNSELETLRSKIEPQEWVTADASPESNGRKVNLSEAEFVTASGLLDAAFRTGRADLQRLILEYLPIFFGRRHGDPSRPWNRFSVRLRDSHGRRVLHYEGNWRDIFQNWEALSFSFPEYLPHFVAKFVNASTVDGFNPYRLTSDGVDWEKVDPKDPWSYIGYWGDHQIVYLLKLLEALSRFQPGRLTTLLGQEIFSFADVPYRLRPFESLLEDPNETVDFDEPYAEMVAERVERVGVDGKLVHGSDGRVLHASLLEKLIVPVLAKMSNLVVDGGIWMNTQRPEWNDANNALVGNGLSVVTLCYLRRFLAFFRAELSADGVESSYEVHTDVLDWMAGVRDALAPHRSALGAGELSPKLRMEILSSLGQTFSQYREKVYAEGLGAKAACTVSSLVEFIDLAEAFVDHTITTNRREDGFFHAYNLVHLSDEPKEAGIERLYEMLEGHVAVLSSGFLTAGEALGLVERLWQSPLYRDDQRSFMLYPERTLPTFFERGRIPSEKALAIPLLAAMAEAKDERLVARDAAGDFRFHGDVGSAEDVECILTSLAEDARWASLAAASRGPLLDLFESVFRHHSFTGRSGTMYAFEGLGSIYWHMVAKLLLAVQEVALEALDSPETTKTGRKLVDEYYRIRSGLGFEKRVQEYGAIPTDPYSHTPSGRGAQQPGMTGQVKEEILTRLGELGVEIEGGRLGFRPRMLQRSEFLQEPKSFEHTHVDGSTEVIALNGGELVFTFAQVPVIYRLADQPKLSVLREDALEQTGAATETGAQRLSEVDSLSVFARRGSIRRIEVDLRSDSI